MMQAHAAIPTYLRNEVESQKHTHFYQYKRSPYPGIDVVVLYQDEEDDSYDEKHTREIDENSRVS